MALFRFPDVASSVVQDDLTALLRETSTILLDPRFSAESDLDDATCAQMAKAINKTAVNAATGAPRHTAFQALIAVQQQLAFEALDNASQHAQEFNGRLSRVISRLFVRVIKTEEACDSPYSTGSVDMESIVCTMEDTLEGCKINGDTSSGACREMVSNLAESILKQNEGLALLRNIMEGAEISVTNSSLAELLKSLAPEDTTTRVAPLETLFQRDEIRQSSSLPVREEHSIAELVTALGSSKEGPGRDAALADLHRHKDEFGTAELNAYLDELSPAFRGFIEEQLGLGVASPNHSDTSNSMSERLRQLRSRLQATETVVKSAVDPAEALVSDQRDSRPALSVSTSRLAQPVRASRLAQPSPRATSRLAQPSPSKARTPSPSKAGQTSAAGNLRERLARSSETSGVSGRTGPTTAAANLRARLEAVKHGKK